MWIGRSASAGSRAIHRVSPSRSNESITAQRAPSFHVTGIVRSPRVSAVSVLLLVIRAELAGFERTPPGLVLTVPGHGRGQGFAERVARRPAEPAHLRGIERVAPVVSGPVLHGTDQRLGFAGQAEDLT